MSEISERRWGSLPSGEPISLFTLRNADGIEATITNYGGRLVTLKVPDRAGRSEDIVLGFDTLDGYLGHNPYFGALVGRFANRIANGQFDTRRQDLHAAQEQWLERAARRRQGLRQGRLESGCGHTRTEIRRSNFAI